LNKAAGKIIRGGGQMNAYPISQVIPESRIVVFSPHYDDVLFFLGGYVLELREQKLLDTKCFHILNLFSRSNYLARTGQGNFDTRLERLKLATGQRLLEDLDCLDELLGEHRYTYEICGERECFARGKSFAYSEMEFPHGMYEHFDEADERIFQRMRQRVLKWASLEDTALVFPVAFKEHIDHFITREAAITVARELGWEVHAAFYFQEDKPYAGIATEEEKTRIENFVVANSLERKLYRHHPETVIELAFSHYLSQVDDVYKKGIRTRSEELQKRYQLDYACDVIYKWHPT
jgi:hypothetical protein